MLSWIEYGLKAKRAWGSNGKSLDENESVDVVIHNHNRKVRVQCRCRKRIPAYLQIPKGCEVMAFKQDYGPVLVLIPAEVYFKLLRNEKKVKSRNKGV